jgi:hypothetical protein
MTAIADQILESSGKIPEIPVVEEEAVVEEAVVEEAK